MNDMLSSGEMDEAKTFFAQDSADDEGWITVNGCKVQVDKEGNITAGMGGKFNGKKISDIKNNSSQSNAKTDQTSVSSATSSTGAHSFSQGFSKNNLNVHIKRHGKEYPGVSKEEYAKKAHDLIQKPVGGDVLGYKAKDGRIARYDKKTNDFVTGHPDVGIATMMKLDGGEKRFEYLKKRDGLTEE